MPSWLIVFILTTAIKFGLAFVLKKFPKLPPEIVAIINTLLGDLKNPDIDNGIAKKVAINKIKECYGVACPSKPVDE